MTKPKKLPPAPHVLNPLPRRGPPKPATEIWRPTCNPWVVSVTLHPDGRIELRFDDGRRIDGVEILNDRMETITCAQVQVMPGEGIVFSTSPGDAKPADASPLTAERADRAGIYTAVWRLNALGSEFAFRAPGSISDGEVLSRAGGGRFRIQVIQDTERGDLPGVAGNPLMPGSPGTPTLIAEREVNFDASYQPHFSPRR